MKQPSVVRGSSSLFPVSAQTVPQLPLRRRAGHVFTVTRQLLAAEPSCIVLEGDDVADFCDGVIDTCAS